VVVEEPLCFPKEASLDFAPDVALVWLFWKLGNSHRPFIFHFVVACL